MYHIISHSLMFHMYTIIGNSSAPSVNTSEETTSHFNFISTSQVTTVQSATTGTTKIMSKVIRGYSE